MNNKTFRWFLVVALCLLAGRAGAGTALRFDGTNAVAQSLAGADFNAFPLSVTTWLRTTNQDNLIRGVVSHYKSSSFNGWSVFLYAGHIRAWYFRDGSDYVWDGSLGLDGGAVADGAWHHVALVVDLAGARLVIDGVQRDSRVWTHTAGASSSSDPLYVGRLDNFIPAFRGEIDEVSIWSEALSLDAVNYIKHRKLTGRETGLLALWHFDEATATSAPDAVNNAHPLTLSGSPGLIPSTAPVVLAPVAASALKLNGVADQVDIPHQSAQNSLPLTLMAWIKTTQTTGAYPGIFTKYQGGAAAGWTLALNTGRLAPWYYADATHFVEPGFSSAADRFVADGQWHHVAFVVDAQSGRTFIDGVLVSIQNWTGTPTPSTTTQDVRIGTYLGGSGQFFNGQIDHASIWNVALSQTQISQYSHLPLTGGEAGLVSAYDFDEASGGTCVDLTGLSNGQTSGAANRVASLARLGDGSQYLLGSLDYASYGRLWAIQNSPNFSAFTVSSQFTLRRFYDYGDAPAPESVALDLKATLADSASTPVALQAPAELTSTVTLKAYNASAPPSSEPLASLTTTALLQIAPASQLQSVSSTYAVAVTFNHQEAGGNVVADEENDLPLANWLHFNGHLFFGSLDTIFTSVGNSPVRGANDTGGFDTILAVNSASGSLVSNSAYHYGDGSSLTAVLHDNGDATELLPAVRLAGPVPDLDCTQNICYIRTNLTLSPTLGIRGTLIMQLPVGLGVTGAVTNHVTTNQFVFTSQSLDTSLHPLATELVVPGPLWAIEESKPFWIGASSLKWEVAAGQILLFNPNAITFTRQSEDVALAAARPTLTEPDSANRVSNDGYYFNASLAPGATVVVTADTNGASQLTTQLTLNATELRPHFPYSGNAAGRQIVLSGAGLLGINRDLIDPVSSQFPVQGALPVIYSRDCFDTNCSGAGIGAATLPFTPYNGTLGFTPDGGLIGFGSIPATDLTWGFAGNGHFAQETSAVSDGVYRMPGNFVMSGQYNLPPEELAPALLLTGLGDATGVSLVEPPDQPAIYANGLANYAGLNFRGPTTARSYLADVLTDWYPLTSRAKYYLRFGGVNGIHESASFPDHLSLYGYDFTFTTYRLSYLDSKTVESRTDGAIRLPEPAGFTQEFQRMQFLCRGGLASAQVPPNSGLKQMVYWHAGITPQTIDFRPLASEQCDTAARFLVLGVETKLPFIPQAFHATLGFHSDGNLVTAAAPVLGCDSRFQPPASLNLKGPGNSVFTLATVGDAYFNNFTSPHKPAAGFYNVVGKIKTPFFGEVKVQLHVSPTGPNTSQVYVMGGWPKADGTGEDKGWNDGPKRNYFTVAKFDPNHDGFPQSLPSADAYRMSKTEDFHPRAQCDWMDVAQFDYPLTWNPVLHEFAGFGKSSVKLPVIDVDSQLKELSPGKVDFDFSQDATISLPRIKVLDFVNDAVDEINAPINSLADAITNALGSALNSSGLTSGFQSLQNVLREDAGPFFTPVLQNPLSQAEALLYQRLADALQNDPAGFQAKVKGIVSDPTLGLGGAISTINGTVSQANSVLSKIEHTYQDVDDTMGLILRVLARDDSGQRHVIAVLIKKLVEDQMPQLGFVGDLADQQAADLTSQLEPTLAEIEIELKDLRSQFNQVHDEISAGAGDLTASLNGIVHDNLKLGDFVQKAADGLADLCSTAVTPAGDYFTADPAAAKKAIHDRLLKAFLGSSMVGDYQTTFRQYFFDGSSSLDGLMDVLFDHVNHAIRDGLEDIVWQGNDGVLQKMKGIGQMVQSLAAAKIRGSPTFEGDSLRRIHLDAYVQINLPDAMNFQAYVDIKELNSSTAPLACIPPGAPAAEVTLGAKNVPLSWKGVNDGGDSPPMTLDVEARWTLQKGAVLGIGGLLDVKGKADFKGVSLKEVGATFAVGEIENYFAAKAAGTVVVYGVPVDVHAGIFAGHACSLDTLKFVDPDVGAVLGNPATFNGIYIEYGGGVSLSKILFGTSTCFLDIEAEVSYVTYYEDGPRSGKIGYRQKDSIDLSLLCFLSGHVDTTMGVSLGLGPSGPELQLAGSAEVCGTIGYCPFCVSGCKGISIRGAVTTGGVNYSIDY